MYILPVAAIAVLVALDQISKYFAVIYLEPVGSVEVIKNVFSLTFVLNDGAAFGMFAGGRWFFIIFSIIILIGIAYYYMSLPKGKVYSWVRFSLILISAGAIGNFIDRLLNGYVVDFLHTRFIDFPVFNIADIYVVAGVFLMAILILFFIKEDKGENENA